MKDWQRWLCAVLAVLLVGCGHQAPPADEPEVSAGPAVSAGEIVDLRCSAGVTTLHFRRSENGAWQWADDLSFPLNGQYVERILSAAQSLSSQTAVLATGEPAVYGLDKTDRYLIMTSGDGTEIAWYFGDRTESNDWYACAAGDPDHICTAPDSLLTLMGRSIYDMAQLPRPMSLTESVLRSVNVTRGDRSDTLRVSAAVWTRQGEDVTDDPDVRALAEALAEVSVDRCLDYAPADGVAELCGLTKPLAVLQVDYVNTVGVDNTLTVTLGQYREDDGAYCVTLNDDPTIYLMSGALPELLKNW